MHSTYLQTVFKVLLSIYICQLQIDICIGYEFNRKYFGVTFAPYVKQFEDGQPAPTLKSYTRANVETMLKLISTKFTNVIVIGDFVQDDKYIFNHTYYYDSFAHIYSGEIAAQMNKKFKNKVLAINYHVFPGVSMDSTLAEINVAVEAAEKANEIFPASVEGIIVDAVGDEYVVSQSLRYLQTVRKKMSLLGIKLGLSPDCGEFLTTVNGTIAKIREQIVTNSDFVVCNGGLAGSPVPAFSSLSTHFLSYLSVAKGIRPATEVVLSTQWFTAKLDEWQTDDSLGIFWKTANQWSEEKNVRIYLSEAFDNPVRRLMKNPELAYKGWWKLSDNSKINSVEGYVEKATGQCNNFQFDRDYVGVSFSPNVVQFSATGFPLKTSDFTFENIETMLTVVSGRFSSILLFGPYGDYDGVVQYEYNVTYRKSWPLLRSGEAAAMLNRIHVNTVLTLTYYVSSSKRSNSDEIEFNLACEAAQKANKIFPGTVTGVAVDTTDFEWDLESLKMLQKRASDIGIKFGAGIKWELLLNENDSEWNHLAEIVKMSDFVLCFMHPSDEHYGPTAYLSSLASYASKISEAVSRITPDTTTVVETHWSSSGRFPSYTVENQKIYWEAASKWAAEKNVHIFLSEAFDIPWRKTQKTFEDWAHRGWWKLDNFKNLNLAEGYVEKISELPGQCTSKPRKVNGVAEEKMDNAGTNGEVNEPLPGNLTTTVTVTAATSCLVILFIAAGLAMWARKRFAVISSKDIRDFLHGSLKTSSDETPGDQGSHLPYDKSLEIMKKNIKLGSNIIGKGEFGLVYKAQVELDGELVDVAVKVPKDNCPLATLNGLLSEIKILSYLGSHAHLVSLLGAYTAELSQGVVFVVTELCPLGSLEKFLRRNDAIANNEEMKHNALRGLEMEEAAIPHEISYSSMLRWAHEIACGMEYLASKHVVHADLATRNVLLTASKTAKISDFGLSRRMYNYKDYVKKNQEPLPWRWMAFEALEKSEFSSKSDAWSYGITLWEIFSKGSIPYSGLSWTHDYNKKLLEGLRPDCPQFASPKIYELMQNCWKMDPADRPTFAEICCLTDTLFQKDFDMEEEDESSYLPIREIEQVGKVGHTDVKGDIH